ncbi:MAG: nucleoside 2-deoxyribosyltransferase [Candidatus Dormibacteria bacterium]
MRLYMAGPLFTPYERAFTSENAAKLRALGFDCFVPHEESVVLADERQGAAPDLEGRYGQQALADLIFAKDNQGLLTADAVVALLDGPTVDDGTACEIGLFYGLMQHDPSKLGIVGILTDTRASVGFEGRGLNLYVLGCIQRAGAVFSSVEGCLGLLQGWRARAEEGQAPGSRELGTGA